MNKAGVFTVVVGSAFIALGGLSILSTSGGTPIIDSPYPNAIDMLLSIMAVLIGVGVLKSGTIAAILASLLATSLTAYASYSVDTTKAINITGAAVNAATTAATIATQSVAQSTRAYGNNLTTSPTIQASQKPINAYQSGNYCTLPDFRGYVPTQRLNSAQNQECDEGLLNWTRTEAGIRNCTLVCDSTGKPARFVWKKAP